VEPLCDDSSGPDEQVLVRLSVFKGQIDGHPIQGRVNPEDFGCLPGHLVLLRKGVQDIAVDPDPVQTDEKCAYDQSAYEKAQDDLSAPTLQHDFP